MSIPIGFAGHVYDRNHNFLGTAGAGKDTVANVLLDLIRNEFSRLHLMKRNLADPIKEICCIKYGLNMSDFEQDVKNLETIKVCGKLYSPRKLAQLEGTELARDIFGTDIWLNSLQQHSKNSDIVFIGDVRFENEARWVKENGILIHVDRFVDDYNNTGEKHISEIELNIDEDGIFYLNNTVDIKNNILTNWKSLNKILKFIKNNT